MSFPNIYWEYSSLTTKEYLHVLLNNVYAFSLSITHQQGPGVAQWLRHCATSRSNPDGVGHRDFSRGYRQNHVPWGQLSL